MEIELSVDGNYALYLNGIFINSGQYPDYPEYKVYDRLNLSDYSKDGENELLIRVWWPRVDHFSYRAESAGLCGACPKECLSDLLAILKENNFLYPITLSYNIFKYDAILMDPENVDWVMEDIARVWGNMLFNGATTFYETEMGSWDFHNAGSLCHGWSAIPIYYYHKYRNV